MKTLEQMIAMIVPSGLESGVKLDEPTTAVVAHENEAALARGYGVGYKGGRCWNGAHRDAGTVNHALPVDACDTSFDTAVCGTKPGSRSYGWVMAQEGEVVTCQRCLAKMTAEQKAAGAGLTRREVRLITLARDSKHGFHGVTETNFRGACKGHSFYDVWMGLVKRGLASRRNAEGVMGYDFAFFPTPAALVYAEAQQGLGYSPDFSEGGLNDLRDKIAGMVGINYENGYWRNAPREEVVQYASKYLVWTGWKWRWPTVEERHERQISEVLTLADREAFQNETRAGEE